MSLRRFVAPWGVVAPQGVVAPWGVVPAGSCGELWLRRELWLRGELRTAGVVGSCGSTGSCGSAGSCVPRGQPRPCWWTVCNGQLVGAVMGCAQPVGADVQSPLVLAASPSEVMLGVQPGSLLEVTLGAAGSPLVLLQGVRRQLVEVEP